LGERQVFRAYLAPHLVGLEFELNFLTFSQSAEAGTLDGRDVHEHILAAIARLNETETLLTVEPLHCSRSHFLFSKAPRLSFHAAIARIQIQSHDDVSGRSPEGRVQKGTTVIEWRYTYRFSAEMQWLARNKCRGVNEAAFKNGCKRAVPA